MKPTEPKKILCIHDLSGMGRCSLAVILPVLSVMGCQPVALPTVVLSTHTGGLGTPARLDGAAYGLAALKHYRELGVEFDCIYTGYLGGEEQVALAEKAFDLWPAARKVVDPVMGDNGKAYSTVTPALIDRMRGLCRRADLILPNATEAALLLEREPQTDTFDDASAQALADELLTLAPSAVVTGLALGKYIGCAGSGRERFVIKKLHISRSFPGTGDLYGAVLIGSLIQGNALSAAADNAAEFVSLAIQQTPADQDTRYGVWFEPLLPRLCPVLLVVLVLRDGAHPVLPNGDTVIEEGDLLVMAAPTFEERAEVTLREITVTPHGRLAGQRLRDVPQGKHPFIVVMLKREGQTIIPDGDTLIYAGDEAVIATLAS